MHPSVATHDEWTKILEVLGRIPSQNLAWVIMSRGAYIAFHVVPAALLIIALAPLPYGFYTMLRFVVCIAAAWLAYNEYQERKQVGQWIIIFGLGALLFNPLIPVHLTRDIWLFLDLSMAAVFALHLWIPRDAS